MSLSSCRISKLADILILSFHIREDLLVDQPVEIFGILSRVPHFPKAQDNSLIEDLTMEIGGDSSPGLPKWTSQSMNKANDGIAKSLCCFHQVDKVVS